MKNIGLKFLIFIGTITILFSLFILNLTYSEIKKNIHELAEKEAAIELTFDLAIRKYVGEKIRPLMYTFVDKDEFIPETMSTSYVAHSIFEEVRKEFPDNLLKFSSDNPRNPANKAGPEELKMIEYFNINPKIDNWTGEITINGKQYMAKFSARRMKPTCLRCHGDPADAPEALLKRYGSTAGFHRPLGQVIGLDTIGVPMSKINKRLQLALIKNFVWTGLVLFVFFLAVILIFRFLVGNRLKSITMHFQNLSKHSDYSRIEKLEEKGNDEISTLVTSFNILLNKFKEYYASLENKVKERTSELQVTNKKLILEVKEHKKTEERFRTVVEQSLAATEIYDSNGRLLSVNDAWAKFWDLKKEDVADFNILDDPECEATGLASAFREAQHGRAKLVSDIKYDPEKSGLLGGRERWINPRMYPIMDQYGKVQNIVLTYEDITDRKQAEKTLRESEDRYRGLVSNIPGIVYRCACDYGWTMQYISDYIEIISGYPSSDFVDNRVRTFESIIHRDDTQMDREITLDAIERKEPYENEYRIIKADGTIRWVYEKGRGVYGDDGEILWLDGAIFDITERRQADEALEKRIIALTRPLEDVGSIAFDDLFNLKDIQRLQDDFSKATGVASIITDIDGTPITAPSNFCRLCNDIIRKSEKGLKNCFKSDAAIGRFHPDGPIIKQCLSGGLWDAGAGITVGGQHIANWLIGQVRDETQTNANMVQYAQEIGVDKQTFIEAFHEVPAMSREQFDTIAQMLFTLATQLSNIAYQNIQQSRFIAERKESGEVLRKSEEKFRGLIETSSEWIWEVNTKGIYTYVSPQIETLLGYKPEEVLGKTLFDLMPPEEAERIEDVFKNNIASGKPITTLENVALHKDGRCLILETSGVAFYDDSGKIGGYRGVDRDITSRRQIEESLRQSQKMEAVGTLAGGIAHDFNNILGGIVGYAELAQDDLSTNNPVQEFISGILNSSARAKDLVKQILTFSRKSQEERKPLQVYPIIKEVVKLIRSTIPATIEMKLNIDESSGMANADPTHIHQIVMNLCTNAGHSMQETGGVLEIDLSCTDLKDENKDGLHDLKSGPYIMLKVSDTGSGIDPDILPRIFEPFFTTKTKEKGTGMGLSVVHGIVKSYSGDIIVESQIGKGSTFTVLLPRVVTEPEKEEDIAVTVPKGTECILFVDDEKTLLDIAEKMLLSLGYNVIACDNSLEALEIFKQQPSKFDLVITDQTMPHMTGYDLAKRILKIKPEVPVILCTGYSSTVTPEKAKVCGIKALIYKPISKKEIARTVREILNKHKHE